MVRAAIQGAFDFATFDPKNRRHRLRLTWTVNELEREARLATNRYEYEYFTALLENPRLAPASRPDILEAATGLRQAILRAYCPWDRPTAAVTDAAAIANDAAARYHAIFGKPGDPEYDRMITEMDKFYARKRRNRERQNAARQQHK